MGRETRSRAPSRAAQPDTPPGMLVRDGTHSGEGQAGRGVSHRTEREGRGLAEVIENPILNSLCREPTRQFPDR